MMTKEQIIQQIERSLKAITEVQVPPVNYSLIDISMSERWLGTNIIREFIAEFFDNPNVKIHHFVAADTYKVEAGYNWGGKAYTDYHVQGTKSRTSVNGYELCEHAIENTCPKFSYKIRQWNSEKVQYEEITGIDGDAVQLAQEKIDSIRNEFVLWMDRLPQERKDEIEQTYNNLYNCYRLRKYDGSHLMFPGLDLSKLGKDGGPIELYQSQKDDVWRIIQQGGAIIDTEVGGGKSLICVIAAHEMKRMKLRNKPCISCLKANVQEITKTYRLAYPSAKVLSPGEKDFEPKNRVRLFHEMKNNDWDCIIMTHDQFGKIQQDPEIEVEIMRDEIDDLQRDLDTLARCGYQISRQMKKGLEKRKENLNVTMKRLLNRIGEKKDEDINFTDIGIDHLMVDECFEYDTLVLTNEGWLKLGEIVEKRKEVMVMSYCEKSRIFELMPITNWLKKPLVKNLVKIKHEHGEITCTEDHKIWTLEYGYIKARELNSGHTLVYTEMSNVREAADYKTGNVLQSEVCYRENEEWRMEMASTQERGKERYANVSMVRGKSGGQSEEQVLQCYMQDESPEYSSSHQGIQTRVRENPGQDGRRKEEPKMLRENEVKQSNEESRNVRENEKESTGQNVSISGRKWTTNSATDKTMSGTRTTGREYGVGNSYQTCMGTISISTEPLQSGYRNTREETVYRSGWENSQVEEVEVPGQTQDGDIKCSRVVSVEVYKREGGSGSGENSTGDKFVYDLTVEKNHNYFADGVLVSNCHRFKNLTFTTRHDRVAGLGNQTGSQKALNMLFAIRTLQKRFDSDLQATFLSGTPISNSLTEMYLLFKYLRPKELLRQNIRNFDGWAAVFAKKSVEFEFGVTNQIMAKERFRHFIKVPELALFYNEIASFRTKKMIGIREPEMVEELIHLEPSEDQKEYIQKLIKFAETGDGAYIDREPLSEGEKAAKMLIATNLAKKMSLDMRLIAKWYEDHPGNKINRCCELVWKHYQSSNEYKGTQLLFCDQGTPGTEGFNVYEAIRDRLVEYGVPYDQITFVHDWTERSRHGWFKKMNDGDVRVLIGSTDKAGTGLNVQQRVLAMHQLDIPWKPAELTQRQGRGVRPGNWAAEMYQDNKVYNYVYATERSLDTYKFTLLKNKATFIAQMKVNELQVRTIDEGAIDEQSGMNFAEYIAVLSGDTTLLEKAKIDKKLAILENLRVIHYREISDNKYKLLHKENRLKEVEPLLVELNRDWELYRSKMERDETGTRLNPIQIPAIQDEIDRNQKLLDELKARKEQLEVEPEEETVEDRKERKQAIKDIRKQMDEIPDAPVVIGSWIQKTFRSWTGVKSEVIGSLYGFDVCIKLNDTKPDKYEELWGSNQRSIIHRNKFYVKHPESVNLEYKYNHGVPNPTSERIAGRLFLNSLERIQGLLETYDKEQRDLVRDIKGLQEYQVKEFGKQQELDSLKAESKRLQVQIQASITNKQVTEAV